MLQHLHWQTDSKEHNIFIFSDKLLLKAKDVRHFEVAGIV